MTTLIIDEKDAGQRLDKFLHRYMPLAGTGFLYKMLRKKNITRNGAKADGSERLRGGDEIRLFLSEETIAKFRTTAAEHLSYRELEVLFENDSFLAVSKPSGILTQRDKSGENALSDDVLGYLLRTGAVTEESLLLFRPSPANRLDRNTSGIVLFGKTLAGQQALAEIIRKRRIRKRYRALVRGYFPDPVSDCAYLLKDPERNQSSTFSRPVDGAEEIRTDFVPVRIFEGKEKDSSWTLLDIELHTGKSHQIRARLADLGTPVAGDPKYGSRESSRRLRERYGLRSQLLHAYRIEFSEEDVPDSLKGLTISAPYPPVFEKILKDLEDGRLQ
ncbi:MAG: RluA family pseudouridine synthase [Lachnospiraceae bacterium]|nr:RluA family pseudouridine synthase [Lachnospiraceae bacterium]